MKILYRDRQKGFTLIEVIATIMLAGVVGAMTFSFFGKSFVEGPKPVSNLNKALGLQAVMENINQDYTRNYAGSDTALSTLKAKIGSVNSTYNNKYGSYKVAYNDFIKFSSTGGTESSSTCGMCAKDLLKVTIQQTDTKETLTALFSSGGASGSGGCGGGCGGGGGGDTTPPTVISTIPSSGAANVAVTSAINVTFSETMTSSTVNTTTFIVTKTSDGSSVTGAVTGSGVTYTFTPSSSLDVSTNYTVTITTGVKDSAGNSMSSSYTWNFTTSATTTDATPPTVSSTCPTSGQTGVSRNVTIKVIFSEAMDPTTINTTTFTVKKTSDGSSVAGTVGYSGTTATFTPSSSLTGSTQYTVMVTTGAKDLAGNALGTNKSWNFTTTSMGMGSGC